MRRFARSIGVAAAFFASACVQASDDPCRADAAPARCATERDGGTLAASCAYAGYGTTCDVPCATAAGVSFATEVRWYGQEYCCGPEVWTDCRCESGHAVCFEYVGDPTRSPPISRCASCGPRDTGPPMEPADAAVDAP